jgi:predicted small metal-binding protein
MALIIKCECGFVVRGETDDELVENAIEHARDEHNFELTREMALSIAEEA